MTRVSDRYRHYSDLAAVQMEGRDYRVSVRPVAKSSIGVLAPHGGDIEAYTSQVASGIAGEDFNLYLFEGIRHSGNYDALHLTSHRFDESRCLAMLSKCDHVVAIHGCSGDAPQALIGGLDDDLKERIADAISAVGVDVLSSGHRFPAVDPKNICNRGRRGIGVQIEMTSALRFNGSREALAAAVRSVLLKLSAR